MSIETANLDVMTRDDCQELETVGSKLSNLAVEKGKIVLEIFINSIFYVKKSFGLLGSDDSSLNEIETSLKSAKSILAVPSFLKGAHDLYGNLKACKMTASKAIADASFVLCDGIESYTALCKELSLSAAYKETLSKIKSVASIVGITKSIIDGAADIEKLEKIDTNLVDPKKVSDESRAVYIKRNWVSSELLAKKCDMFKNVTGLALTVLALLINPAYGYYPWVFSLVGTASLAAKVMNAFHKEDSAFWRNRYAEIVK